MVDPRAPAKGITGLAIQLRKGGLDLTDDERVKFGAIGYTLMELSRLEFEIDEFAFKLANEEPELAKRLSRKFPQQLEAKKTFVVEALNEHELLSKIEDSSGEIDLPVIQGHLDYVFAARNDLIHGASYSAYMDANGASYTFKRYERKRDEGPRGRFEKRCYRITEADLDQILTRVQYLSAMLTAASKVLDGVDIWKEAAKLRDGRALARQMLDEFEKHGGEVDDAIRFLWAITND